MAQWFLPLPNIQCPTSDLLYTIDLKIENLDRVSIPAKSVAAFDIRHPIHGDHLWRPTKECIRSSDQVFLSENLEIYHLALPLQIQVKEIERNMAGKRVEEITNKVMMIN